MIAAATPISIFYGRNELFVVVCALGAGPAIGGFENSGIATFRKDMNFAREFLFLFSKRALAFAVTIAALDPPLHPGAVGTAQWRYDRSARAESRVSLHLDKSGEGVASRNRRRVHDRPVTLRFSDRDREQNNACADHAS